MIESKFKQAIPFILFGLIGILVLSVTTFNVAMHNAKADTASTAVSVGNATPTLSVTLNSGLAIGLNEGTWKSVTTTITVTDLNGCSTISSVSATLWWADTNAASSTACTYDGETCYPSGSAYDIETLDCTATTTGNVCAGEDTTEEWDCAFHVWYIATSTQSIASKIWSVAATSTDSGGLSGTASNTTEVIEINTLNSLDVTASIDYGSLTSGGNTGATNQSTTVTDTGNAAIDIQLSSNGEYMCTNYDTCDGDKIGVWKEEYKLSTFTYGDGTADSLSGTTTPSVELIIDKPKATTTPDQTDIVYWGMGIPSGQASGSYTGQNLFTAESD